MSPDIFFIYFGARIMFSPKIGARIFFPHKSHPQSSNCRSLHIYHILDILSKVNIKWFLMLIGSKYLYSEFYDVFFTSHKYKVTVKWLAFQVRLWKTWQQITTYIESSNYQLVWNTVWTAEEVATDRATWPSVHILNLLVVLTTFCRILR